jgi:drug/metabolite transporter (DMT)-like permease
MRNHTAKYQMLGVTGLLAAAVIWGFSFVIVKDSTDRIPIIYLLSFRYLLAVFFMLPLFYRKRRVLTKECIVQGAVLGGLLCLSQFFQTLGCKYTTAGKNAFITTIYVILVPFFLWGLEKKRPDKRSVWAAGIAMAGLGLLSLQEHLRVQGGDWITMLCGIGLSFHIIWIDRYTKRNDPVLLTFLQFFFAGILSWAGAAVSNIPFPREIFYLEDWLGILYLGIFSTMAGFLLQVVCQKYTNPNLAAIILSTEAVFGMIFSVIFLHETLTLRMAAGCVCMFTAVLIAQIKVSCQPFWRERRSRKAIKEMQR